MDIKSIESLVITATEENKKISDIVIDIEANSQKVDRNKIIEQMSGYYDIMRESVVNGKKEKFNFVTGLQDDCVEIVEKFYKNKKSILGETIGKVVTAAMAVSGYNACMGKIIAAPTAGSCGIMPAVLTVCENRGYKREDIVHSMFTAAGLADIIAQLATFAGAGGGCQAECGSASVRLNAEVLLLWQLVLVLRLWEELLNSVLMLLLYHYLLYLGLFATLLPDLLKCLV